MKFSPITSVDFERSLSLYKHIILSDRRTHMTPEHMEQYILKELKTSKTKIKQFTKVNEKVMHASYLISLRIAKAGKPHTIGENLVLPAIKDAVGVMFGDKSSKDVEMIPLSNDTVERRINEMSQWTEDELIQRVRKSSFFSLQLDESTDVQGLCQLLVFIRYIWNNGPHEDMLFCEPIIRGTQGADIFAVHDKIKGFMKKLTLWQRNIEKQNYDCFETFQIFITENDIKVADDIISHISLHLISLKDNFNFYLLEEMKKYEQNSWVVNPFQKSISTGISTKADEELIDLSENSSLKLQFSRNNLKMKMFPINQLLATNTTRVQRTRITRCDKNAAKKQVKNPILLTKTKVIRPTWIKGNFTQNESVIKFKTEFPMPHELKNLETTKDFFNYFFDDCLLSIITEQTKLYSTQVDPSKPITLSKTELQRFLGILIMMSVNHVSNSRSYWSDNLGNIPIKNYLSPNHEDRDRPFKIRTIVDLLKAKFSSVPFDEFLALDEQLCPTKVLKGYAYNFEIYTGNENNFVERQQMLEPDLGATGNVVVRLSRVIPRNEHHKLYFDNYYTSIPVMVYLEKLGIHTIGTFRRNRFPDIALMPEKDMLKKPRGTYDECLTVVDGVPITTVSWKDNKIVNVTSTFIGALEPTIVRRYDKKQQKKRRR
ncbi:hypothetical protein QTP88_010706 [Uroleucon formosanum]